MKPDLIVDRKTHQSRNGLISRKFRGRVDGESDQETRRKDGRHAIALIVEQQRGSLPFFFFMFAIDRYPLLLTSLDRMNKPPERQRCHLHFAVALADAIRGSRRKAKTCASAQFYPLHFRRE